MRRKKRRKVKSHAYSLRNPEKSHRKQQPRISRMF